jgi:hypothetical protein
MVTKAIYHQITGPGSRLYSVHIPDLEQEGWGTCVGHFVTYPSYNGTFVFKAGAPHLEFTSEILNAIAEALKELNA